MLRYAGKKAKLVGAILDALKESKFKTSVEPFADSLEFSKEAIKHGTVSNVIAADRNSILHDVYQAIV